MRTMINGRAFSTDSAGFRGEEEYSIPASHKIRILLVGDSRTYGMAVSDDSTYAHILQSELRGAGHDAETINTGTPGYTAVQCRAKLEQLLHYKPDIVVFAAGYNDRRYLLSTPPDSSKTFRRTACLRRFLDTLQRSNIFFAISFELGQRRLRTLRDNPPPLDRVEVRVPEAVFREEIQRCISICRENDIDMFFLLIQQEPFTFGIVEDAAQRIERKEYQDALNILNKSEPDIPIAAVAFCHYLQGICYRALGKEEQACEWFADHQPVGSLHGEAILRNEARYFGIIREIALRENIPVLDSRDAVNAINEQIDDPAIQNLLERAEEENRLLMDGSELNPRVDGRVTDMDDFFRARFIDGCHYDELGHALIGKALAEKLEEYCIAK
ncbi:MAG: GDSL-type esterase/lipase family protein [bacterium]